MPNLEQSRLRSRTTPRCCSPPQILGKARVLPPRFRHRALLGRNCCQKALQRILFLLLPLVKAKVTPVLLLVPVASCPPPDASSWRARLPLLVAVAGSTPVPGALAVGPTTLPQSGVGGTGEEVVKLCETEQMSHCTSAVRRCLPCTGAMPPSCECLFVRRFAVKTDVAKTESGNCIKDKLFSTEGFLGSSRRDISNAVIFGTAILSAAGRPGCDISAICKVYPSVAR